MLTFSSAKKAGLAMLKGLHPLLVPDLLYVLRSMGHGDELVLADRNFPSASVAADTVSRTHISLAGTDVVAAARAILSVMPIDTFVEPALWRMAVVGAPDEIPPVQAEVQAVVDAAEGRPRPFAPIERMAFYERARQAFAVVSTGEDRGYACFIFKKGIVLADGSTA